jgi:hypothetical protein
MAFWSNPTAPEPKRNYRWYVNFDSGNGLLSNIRYAVKKVDKPKAKIGEVTHKYLNHSFYYPGRLEWESVNLTMASVTDPDATSTLFQILRNAGYFVPSNVDPGSERASIGKNKFDASIGRINIFQVNADGVDIEQWTLIKPFFTSVQFGSLDYGNEDIVEISMTIRYDYAELNQSLGGASILGNLVGPPAPG